MKKIVLFLLVCTIGLIIFGCSKKNAIDDGTGYIFVTNYLNPDTDEDLSDKIQKIIDENPNRTIFFPDGTYKLSKPICTPADPAKAVSLKLSSFAILKASDDWSSDEAVVRMGGKDPYNEIRFVGSNYSFEGGYIDGNGKANGISIDSGRETVIRETSIKNAKIGLHIKHGANNGSSDADIYGVNIIGTGTTDSVGVLLEGFDNTLTNMRIGNVFIGVEAKSGGNSLKNIHALYMSDCTDYNNSCGFYDKAGSNWYDFCYSDQFGIGFRLSETTTGNFTNCYCFWYSKSEKEHIAVKADGKFNSNFTNFKVDFNFPYEGGVLNNVVLSVEKSGGTGFFTNLSVNEGLTLHKTYKKYIK